MKLYIYFKQWVDYLMFFKKIESICVLVINTPDLWRRRKQRYKQQEHVHCIYNAGLWQIFGRKVNMTRAELSQENHLTVTGGAALLLHVLMVTEDGGRGIRLRVTLNPLKIIILICKTGWRCMSARTSSLQLNGRQTIRSVALWEHELLSVC